MKFILASKSPRRIELLKRVIKEFDVTPSDVDETLIKEADPVKFAIEAAKQKAMDVGSRFPSDIVIGSDTIVVLDNKILGKPKDPDEAKQMLNSLSGITHKAITGIALYKKDEDKLLCDFEITYVSFNKLSDKDIDDYIKSETVHDKAGSYAIQDIGDKFVKSFRGDYHNVVGLPLKLTKQLIDRFMAKEITVEIIDMALPDNFAVAKHEGSVFFIPDAVIGDKVAIRTFKKEKKLTYGEVVKIVESSPFRVKPECPHFGICGGCAFQNLKYEKQLELKQNYLLQTLQRIGKLDLNMVDVQTISPSPSQYYYRNKMEYAFGNNNGDVVLGLRERSSIFKKDRIKIIPLSQCPIFSRNADKIFSFFNDLAKANKLTAFNAYANEGFLRNLSVRESKHSKDLMITLMTSNQDLNIEELYKELIKKVPEVKSFYWVINSRPADVVDFQEIRSIHGDAFINEQLGDLTFKIYPQVFFQPNSAAAEGLYKKIAELAQIKKNKKALGLYCGTGTIEIFISKYFEEIIGIDINPVNITTARENCEQNHISNCIFVEGRVEDTLKQYSSDIFDMLIVDPPRAGIGGKGLKLISKLKTDQIIYVSCNPSTLARDLVELSNMKYSVKKIIPFDLFPHTPHLETLVYLESVK